MRTWQCEHMLSMEEEAMIKALAGMIKELADDQLALKHLVSTLINNMNPDNKVERIEQQVVVKMRCSQEAEQVVAPDEANTFTPPRRTGTIRDRSLRATPASCEPVHKESRIVPKEPLTPPTPKGYPKPTNKQRSEEEFQAFMEKDFKPLVDILPLNDFEFMMKDAESSDDIVTLADLEDLLEMDDEQVTLRLAMAGRI